MQAAGATNLTKSMALDLARHGISGERDRIWQHLAAPGSSYLTGPVLTVDGGGTAGYSRHG